MGHNRSRGHASRPPPSMLFMKAKKDPTYTGVKSTVSAATCMQQLFSQAGQWMAQLMRLSASNRRIRYGRFLL